MSNLCKNNYFSRYGEGGGGEGLRPEKFSINTLKITVYKPETEDQSNFMRIRPCGPFWPNVQHASNPYQSTFLYIFIHIIVESPAVT